MEEKIWKMIALDMRVSEQLSFSKMTVSQINGGPSAIIHIKNALVTQIQEIG